MRQRPQICIHPHTDLTNRAETKTSAPVETERCRLLCEVAYCLRFTPTGAYAVAKQVQLA